MHDSIHDTRAQPSLSTILLKTNDILFCLLICEIKRHASKPSFEIFIARNYQCDK